MGVIDEPIIDNFVSIGGFPFPILGLTFVYHRSGLAGCTRIVGSHTRRRSGPAIVVVVYEVKL